MEGRAGDEGETGAAGAAGEGAGAARIQVLADRLLVAARPEHQGLAELGAGGRAAGE
jgi:hypothetical protein